MDRIVRRNSQAGITMIETLMAGAILVIGSLSMITLIINSIASNNRNRIDSTQTMLVQSVLEQINSSVIGAGTSYLVDCAGTSLTIETSVPISGSAGSAVSGSVIDFTEASPATGYHMDYVINTPCESSGTTQGTYDVRWHLDRVGVTTTNTFLITVSAKLKGHGEGNKFFSLPVTLRMMSGN